MRKSVRPAAPTILDVAHAASVSRTTASDALSGSGRVSEQTRLAVAAAADRLGYTPNRSARNLRTSTTETIGLHIPEFLTRSEYYMSFVFGVAEGAGAAGYNVTLITAQHLPLRGATPQVDGLILCDPVAKDPMVRRLMGAEIPVVTAERYAGSLQPAGVVWSDHKVTFRQLLDHVRGSGARLPALLGSGAFSDWSTTLHRTYTTWCRQQGVPRILHVPHFGASAEELRTAVRGMLDANPDIDFLICAADAAATTILPELTAAGREIGRDILLASCVDSTAMSAAQPAITAIDLAPRTMGAECARLLIDIVAGEAAPGAVRTTPIELHLRDSTRWVR